VIEPRVATTVLDASALLALIRHEPGADRVLVAISEGALVSAVNWSEVLATLVVAGGDPYEITAMALPGGATTRLQLIGFDDQQARECARLVRYTRHLRLSLADRAALALGQLRRLPVLTSDRAWRSLRLPIKIEVIR
jgi:PIN domain nuclease of toxin-antitoxin system